jgi:hypothetical protein
MGSFVKESRKLARPQFSVLSEDLDKPLSWFHKARCRMDECTGLQQLTILLLFLITVCPTQKMLADEVSPRDPPRSLSFRFLNKASVGFVDF